MQPPQHPPIIERPAPPAGLDAVAGGPRILTGAAATLGVIFRIFGGAYLEQYGAQVSDEQRRVLQLIALCRTSVLGVAHWECEQCGHVHELYNPCQEWFVVVGSWFVERTAAASMVCQEACCPREQR